MCAFVSDLYVSIRLTISYKWSKECLAHLRAMVAALPKCGSVLSNSSREAYAIHLVFYSSCFKGDPLVGTVG